MKNLTNYSRYRGDEKIEGTTTVKGGDGDYSKSELEIITNRTDNGKVYRCEVSNLRLKIYY